MAGRTGLVTGANAGIGRATAAARGARVILLCRDPESP
jgi:NAD(P)-dependent dehydrogenase (short-subunit alcohol dehydrogenase family)